MDKLAVFQVELNYIKNKEIKKYAELAVNSLPDYFFEIPASSTGKYHPTYTLGNGGLVRHVQACVRFVVECFRLDWYKNLFNSDQQDLIIVSLLLHDGWKSGKIKQQFTVEDHPVVAVNELKENNELNTLLPPEYLDFIYENIETHMGGWRFYRSTNLEFAPAPKTNAQKLVHFVDYACSRKMFEVDFNVIPARD